MQQQIVFFDGFCNLCSGSVQFIIKHDKQGRFRFASLQSKTAAEMITDPKLQRVDSILLLNNDRFYSKSTAALRIAYSLDFPLNLLSVFLIVPAFIRNAVYDIIAARRYRWFGRKPSCWLPEPGLKSRFLE